MTTNLTNCRRWRGHTRVPPSWAGDREARMGRVRTSGWCERASKARCVQVNCRYMRFAHTGGQQRMYLGENHRKSTIKGGRTAVCTLLSTQVERQDAICDGPRAWARARWRDRFVDRLPRSPFPGIRALRFFPFPSHSAVAASSGSCLP